MRIRRRIVGAAALAGLAVFAGTGPAAAACTGVSGGVWTNGISAEVPPEGGCPLEMPYGKYTSEGQDVERDDASASLWVDIAFPEIWSP